ncbi:hypothetical protein, partial [Paenibacillus contaminans]|uniref:hypothetical protein n=1 Tax=Paenibacillus contaminans TaxID=450362 RepID=UPI001EDDBD50
AICCLFLLALFRSLFSFQRTILDISLSPRLSDFHILPHIFGRLQAFFKKVFCSLAAYLFECRGFVLSLKGDKM